MYSVTGWLELSDDTEDSRSDRLQEGVARVREHLESVDWQNGYWTIQAQNGLFFLLLSASGNRPRSYPGDIEDLLSLVCQVLPGSYGLLYTRNADLPPDQGGNSFHVTRVARGKVDHPDDTLLSPINPMIED